MAVFLILQGCSKDRVESESGPQEISSQNGSYEDGIVIVRFSDEMLDRIESDLRIGKLVTRSAGLNSALDALGIKSMVRLFPDAGEFEERTRKAGLHKYYKIAFDSNEPVTKAMTTMEEIPGVESVEGQFKIEPRGFNDPDLSKQWHYLNVGNGNMRSGADINVSPVWEQFTTGDSKVIVAIVDGGIETDHPDLKDNVIPGGQNGSKNFVDGTFNIVAHGHGTHVAGIVGAINNNGTGGCGIAGGDMAKGIPGVRLLSCQIFKHNEKTGKDESGSGAEAIKWAADHGAVIAQNSWGYNADSNNDGTVSAEELADFTRMSIPSSLKSAIDYFTDYAGCDNNGDQLPDSPMKGGVVIFAAGNENISYDPVGAYDRVISVGSIDSKGYKSAFSNYGDWVDICAPGSDIYSTVSGGKYQVMSGTSMACPHVSGVAALLVSYFGGQGFTAEALRYKLIGGAKKGFISNNSKIGDLVDALGAFSYGGENVPSKVTEYNVSSFSNNINFSWNVTGSSKKTKAYGFLLMATKEKKALESVNPKSPSASIKYSYIQTPEDANVGSVINGKISGLDFESTYYVAIAASDYLSNYSEISGIKTIKTLENNPPVISGDNSGVTIHAYQEYRIPVSIVEPDGHGFNIEFDGGSAAAELRSGTNGEYTVIIDGKKAEAGIYAATIRAMDSYGMTSVWKKDYEILQNQAPVCICDFENLFSSTVGDCFSYDASEYFSDPDGEPLKYTFEISNPDVIHINSSENILYATILGHGVSLITVTATDALGESANSSFTVIVRDPSIEYVAYPNPVTDILNIATGAEPADVHVRVSSMTGGAVFDGTLRASAFEPAVIDLSDRAPGRYSAVIRLASGKEYKQTIVKK